MIANIFDSTIDAVLSELSTEIGILNFMGGVGIYYTVKYYMRMSHQETLELLRYKSMNDWVAPFNLTHKANYNVILFMITYFLVSILIAATNQ